MAKKKGKKVYKFRINKIALPKLIKQFIMRNSYEANECIGNVTTYQLTQAIYDLGLTKKVNGKIVIDSVKCLEWCREEEDKAYKAKKELERCRFLFRTGDENGCNKIL